MKDNDIFTNMFNALLVQGSRLPIIYDWLSKNVWSGDNYNSKNLKNYFEDGERLVLKLEELILLSAGGVYDELASAANQHSNLLDELKSPKTALVIFDGASLRELPVLKKLAVSTGFRVVESGYKISSLPSDTISFIEQRILGKQISPIQLESRRELKEKGIKAYYYDQPIRHFDINADDTFYILWSSFPDGTYINFEARNSLHFESLVKQFDVAWKNIILSIPKDYRIIITSDHGYVYLSAGFESSDKGKEALNFLEQERFKYFNAEDEVPENLSGIQIVPDRNLAMVRGRIKNHPKGHAAKRVFRHGGLSLMEMLTPWLVIEKN